MKHSNPPQKVHTISRGEVHKSLLVALISLSAVIVLTLLLLFASNFVGKVIQPTILGNSVQVHFNYQTKDLTLIFSVNKEVNGVYFELHGVDLDLCDTDADITVVENPLNSAYPTWHFTEKKCDAANNIIQFSKAAVDPDTFIKPSAAGGKATIIVKLHLKKLDENIPSFSLQLQNVHVMATTADASGNFNLFDDATTETDSFNAPSKGGETPIVINQPQAPIITPTPLAPAAGQVTPQPLPPATTQSPVIVPSSLPQTTTQPQNQTDTSQARQGRGYGCLPEWQCGQWGYCNATLQQGRDCTDLKSCSRRPRLENRSCAACEESWICAAWSGCSNGRQTRSCTDEHQCRTFITQPQEQQSCIAERGYVPPPIPPYQPPVRSPTPPEKKSFWELLLLYKWFIIAPLLLLLLGVFAAVFLRRHGKGQRQEEQRGEGFNYDELRTWVQQGLQMGLSPEQLWQRLQQETSWKKEDFEKVMERFGGNEKWQ